MQRSRSIATSGESSSGFLKWRFGSMKRDRPAPQPNEMSCSGHSPPLSQTGQSSGWFTSRNSTTAFCACLTRSEVVTTTIPSLTGVERGRAGVLGRGERARVEEKLLVALPPRRLHVRLELRPELLDHRADRHRHRVAEDAEAVADDVRLDLRHDLEVHRGGLAGVD